MLTRKKRNFKTIADSHLILIDMGSCVVAITNMYYLAGFMITAICFHYGICRDEDKIMKGE